MLQHSTWSLGETRSLSIKATRGAGMSWGLAEEAGFVVQYLEQHGYKGVDVLAGYLQYYNEVKRDNQHRELSITENNIHSKSPLNPLLLGAWIRDSQTLPLNGTLDINYPLLILPYLSSMSNNQSYHLRWEGVAIECQKESIITKNTYQDLMVETATCTIKTMPSKHLNIKTQKYDRTAHSSKKALSTLADFAYRIYAPETESSRLSGAGAGLNDND